MILASQIYFYCLWVLFAAGGETSKYFPDGKFVRLAFPWLNRHTLLTWKHTPPMMRLQPWGLENCKDLFLFMQAWVGLQKPWRSCYCPLLDH